MNSKALGAAGVAALTISGAAGAEDAANYSLRSAGDLAALCSASHESPTYAAAIHMCEGYIVGVHQLHEAIYTTREAPGFYCLPADKRPSRDAAAADFAAWVQSDASAAALPAVEGVVRWAHARFPCK